MWKYYSLAVFSSNFLTARAFIPALRDLNDYGCFCNFSQDRLNQQGQIQDAYDQLCFDLNSCLNCPRINGTDFSPAECNNFGVEEQPFNSVDPFWFDKKELSRDPIILERKCMELNFGDNCASHSCVCHSKFTDELLASTTKYNRKFKFQKKLQGNCPVDEDQPFHALPECQVTIQPVDPEPSDPIDEQPEIGPIGSGDSLVSETEVESTVDEKPTSPIRGDGPILQGGAGFKGPFDYRLFDE